MENASVVEKRLENLEKDVRELRDKSALVSLMNEYCHSVDRRDLDTWARCFTEDGEFTIESSAAHKAAGVGSHQGRDNVRAAGSAIVAAFACTQHSMTGLEFDVQGDGATGQGYLLGMLVPDADKPRENLCTGGPYRWEFARTADGWKIKKLVFRIDWVLGQDPHGIFS